MDGIRNLIGRREVKLRLGVRTYRLTTRTLEDIADRESYILELKSTPSMLLQSPGLSDSAKNALTRRVKFSAYVSLEEDAAFDNSMHGLCFRLWLALRAHHSHEIESPDDVYRVVYRYGRNQLCEIQAMLMFIEEHDILEKLIFPDQNSGPEVDTRQHKRRIAWAKIVRQLAETFQWTPDQIGKLTLYRAMVLLGAQCPEDIRRTVAVSHKEG